MSDILRHTSDAWGRVLQKAWDARKSFDADAKVFKSFFEDDNQDWQTIYGARVFGDNGPSVPMPESRANVNKVAEYVDLHLPYLFQENPTRRVTSTLDRLPPELVEFAGIDPAAHEAKLRHCKLRAWLQQHMLNYTPRELWLKREIVLALTEALLTGRGLLWQEIRTVGHGPNRRKLVGSFFDTNENLLIDPDASCLRDAGWIARRRVRTKWALHDELQVLGVKLDDIKPNGISQTNEACSDPRSKGSKDLVHYWEVYSRVGAGGRLEVTDDLRASMPAVASVLDTLGMNCYLMIAPQHDFPLNLPPWLASDPNGVEKMRMFMQWHTPFHDDPVHPWPMANLDLSAIPNRLWPKAPLAKVKGHQLFLNWAYSFLMDHIARAGKQIVVGGLDLSKEFTNAITCGRHLEFIQANLRAGESAKDALDVIQFPPLNTDWWQIISAVERQFELGSGMLPLMYGAMDQQMRSAQESQDRHQMATLRPAFMGKLADDFYALAARNEAIMARFHYGPEDVAAAFGETYMPAMPMGAMFT